MQFNTACRVNALELHVSTNQSSCSLQTNFLMSSSVSPGGYLFNKRPQITTSNKTNHCLVLIIIYTHRVSLTPSTSTEHYSIYCTVLFYKETLNINLFVPVCWLQLPRQSICVQNEIVEQDRSRAVGFDWVAEALQC